MPKFSNRSLNNKATLELDLQLVLEEAIRNYDFTIICGYRGKDEQNTAFKEGHSKLKWPESRHNQFPSRAVDIIPYPSGFTDENEFYVMATYVLAAANKLGIEVVWGGHWKTLVDKPHFELK